MIVSFTRQLVVLVPVAYLLSKTGVLENVWWAFPIAEVFSLAVTLISYSYVYKKIISHVGEKAVSSGENSLTETKESST
ncbi:MAG: hypothetical protein MSH34_03875, partial [Oscillospiraceae bacterium]|nr:hypothetical protein [Oscillospiraceae bacterium]